MRFDEHLCNLVGSNELYFKALFACEAIACAKKMHIGVKLNAKTKTKMETKNLYMKRYFTTKSFSSA